MIIEYHDLKSEGRRLLNHLHDEVIIFRPDQEPINHIAPTGPVEHFCWAWMAEFAKTATLHPATWPEAAEICVQIERGLKPGDPPPGLIDFRNIFRKRAENGSPKLFSVAGALDELCSVLGRTAYIRRAPSLDGIARVFVYEYAGIPHKLWSFFIALRFMRLQMEAAVEGRESDRLRRVVIIDEGQEAFSKELSQPAGSGYIASTKRFLTQGRSTGTGIVTSIQSLLGTDEILPGNAGTAVVFGCKDYTLAAKAAELLGAPQLAADIQNLPHRIAYVRSSGFSGPVKIRVPEFDLGPYPSNEEVQRRQADKLAALAAQTVYAPEHPEEQPTLDYLQLLGERPSESSVSSAVDVAAVRSRFLGEHQAFLREIEASPSASTTEHYVALKWGFGHADRVKNQLIEMNLICIERQRSGAGRPVEILLLTQTGRQFLNESAH